MFINITTSIGYSSTSSGITAHLGKMNLDDQAKQGLKTVTVRDSLCETIVRIVKFGISIVSYCSL